MRLQELAATAHELVGSGKGILAMDESNATCNKRFAGVGRRKPRTPGAPGAS